MPVLTIEQQRQNEIKRLIPIRDSLFEMYSIVQDQINELTPISKDKKIEQRYTKDEVVEIIKEGMIHCNKHFKVKKTLTAKDYYTIGIVCISFNHHLEKQQK